MTQAAGFALPPTAQAAVDRAYASVWTSVDSRLAELARTAVAGVEGAQPETDRERAWLELVEQFVVYVPGVTAMQIEAAGADEALVSALYVLDQTQRLELVLGAVPHESTGGDVIEAVRDLHAAAILLDGIDPATTELVRLRCARYHDCHT